MEPPADVEPAPEAQTVVVGEPVQSPPLHFALDARYMYGHVRGTVQDPRGGKRGTTSGNRPNFGETGVSEANIYDGELSTSWDPNQEVFVGAQIVHLSGGATLHKALISDGFHFPKHAHVSSIYRMDWYRLGYSYRFVLDQADNGVPDLTLTPRIEAILWDFEYSLNGAKFGKARERTMRPTAMIGGILAWRPDGGPLSLEADVGSFPALRTMPQISVEQLLARYRFYQWRRLEFTGLLGVAWEQQAYSDRKRSSDRVSANFGPMGIAGVQISY